MFQFLSDIFFYFFLELFQKKSYWLENLINRKIWTNLSKNLLNN